MKSHKAATTPATPRPTAITTAAVVDWALLALAIVIVVAMPKDISGDGRNRFESLARLLTTGHLTSSRYSLVGPMLSAPLYLLGLALGAAKAVTAFYNVLLFLLALGLVGREFRDELSPTVRRMLLLLLVFASMFAHHAQRYYGEVFTAVFVLVGVLWLSRGLALRGWAAIILGTVNTPACLLGVAGVAICHGRRTRSWLPLLGPAAAFAVMCIESFVVRGHPLATGYGNDAGFRTALPYAGLPNFSYPFFFGLLALVLSFGKGLVFFTPGLFLPLPSSAPPRFRWVHQTLVVFVVGLVLTYAKWWGWYGGWFWGPRFFLIASVPACFSLACNLSGFAQLGTGRRILLAVALALSFWVGVNGLVFKSAGLGICTENRYALEAFCHFVPEMSVLWHPFVDGAASLSPPQRTWAFVLVGLWTVAMAWLGRELFADLGRRAAGFARRWRAWW